VGGSQLAAGTDLGLELEEREREREETLSWRGCENAQRGELRDRHVGAVSLCLARRLFGCAGDSTPTISGRERRPRFPHECIAMPP